MGMIAGVVGATGLIGKAVVAQLCNDATIDTVHVLTRRTLADVPAAANPKLIQHVIDFNRLTTIEWPRCDVFFCCLGTTIRTAGSRTAFRTVDFDYVVESARRARQAGASHLIVVSAMGANPHSKILYNRIKGEMEAAVATLGFDTVVLFRPSLLEGERIENRPGERFALAALKIVNFLLPKKYRPIHVRVVARSMIAAAKAAPSGVTVVESDQIQDFV